MRNVLTKMKVIENTKGEGFSFVNRDGKIFLIDKSENDITHQLGDVVDVWVKRELPNYGFVKTTIDNLSIKDYIKSIFNKTFDDYFLYAKGSHETTLFSNQMYNDDARYYDRRIKQDTVLPKGIMEVYEYFDRYSFQKETDEHVYDIAVLHEYLYKIYSKISDTDI